MINKAERWSLCRANIETKCLRWLNSNAALDLENDCAWEKFDSLELKARLSKFLSAIFKRSIGN